MKIMKVHTATLVAGIIFLLVGLFAWYKYDAIDKMFALGVNLMGTGMGIIVISLLVKLKK